jgi:hypothetical protein
LYRGKWKWGNEVAKNGARHGGIVRGGNLIKNIYVYIFIYLFRWV